MNRKSQLAFLLISLLFLLIVFATGRYADARASKVQLNHERCADQANQMVASFLRNNSAFAARGSFVQLSGTGFTTPGPWNLQGGFYLALRRTAQFTGGTEALEIIIQKGQEPRVFQPRPEHPVIYVSTPDLWED